jgi:hypothetical protein
MREVGCWDLRRHGFVVGPQRDLEAVTLVAAWLHSLLQSSHGAPGFGEPLSKLDLELSEPVPYMCDSGKDVTRQQTECELVRVVKNHRVVDWQVKRRGDRPGRSHRTRNLHLRYPEKVFRGSSSELK